MGFWDVLFRSDSGSGSTKIRQSKEDNSKIRADRISSVGGENSSDRGYKK